MNMRYLLFEVERSSGRQVEKEKFTSTATKALMFSMVSLVSTSNENTPPSSVVIEMLITFAMNKII
jgi:hypothetical protein